MISQRDGYHGAHSCSQFTDGAEIKVVASAFTPKSWVYKVAWLLIVSYGHRTLKARLPVRSALVKQ
jgi:hypothetical protein